MGDNPPISPNGRVKIDYPERYSHQPGVEHTLAKLAIIEQFELFKDFMKRIGGPVNKHQVESWKGRIPDTAVDLFPNLVTRRNELTHDYDCELPTMKQAVEYFNALRWLAPIVNSAI